MCLFCSGFEKLKHGGRGRQSRDGALLGRGYGAAGTGVFQHFLQLGLILHEGRKAFIVVQSYMHKMEFIVARILPG